MASRFEPVTDPVLAWEYRKAGLLYWVALEWKRTRAMAKKLPCPCGERTVPGLVKGVSLCQKHFNGLFYAPHDSPEHKEAQAVYFRNFTRNKQESK